MKGIPIKYLEECFICFPDEGALYWQHRPEEHFKTVRAWKISNKKYVGKKAGCVRKKDKFIQVRFMGHSHSAHRIIYAMESGHWPDGVVYHIDGNHQNNKITNLVEISYTECRMIEKGHYTIGKILEEKFLA